MNRLLALLAAIACLAVSASVSAQPGAISPSRLRTEYLVAPTAIDEPAPRLSWVLAGEGRGVRQSAYRILAASSAEKLGANEGDLWDSGKVSSSDTNQLAYAGKPLASRQQVWWKVMAWDQADRPGSWSEPARWEMGLLAPADWKAQWITTPRVPPAPDGQLAGARWIWIASGPGAESALPGGYIFRRAFDIPAGRRVVSATAAFAGDNAAQAYINGSPLDPSPSSRRAKPRDAASLLVAGRNAIAVLVTKRNVPARVGMLGALRVKLDDGSEVIVASDEAWKASGAGAGEGWAAAGFDDAAWPASRIVGENGMEPWGRVGTEYYLPPARDFRREFTASKPVRRAVWYAAALGLETTRLNGAPVGDGIFNSGWSDYDKRVYYRAWDVTDRVAQGPNALAVTLADGWFSGYNGWGGNRDFYGTDPLLLGQLVIDYADGSQETVATGADWKWVPSSTVQADQLMGELHDARLEQAGWDRPGFAETAAWQPAVVSPARPIAVESHPAQPVRVIRELKASKIAEPKPGVFVFDMGEYSAGFARLRVRGAKAGDRIRLQFAERVLDDGTVYTENLRIARSRDTYITRGGAEETWTPSFTFHGFQYVQVEGYPGRPGPDNLVALTITSDAPRAGWFESSDPVADRLFQNILNTQWANFIEAPTDCPQRDERQGWTGDAQVYMRTATYNNDVSAFFTKWLVDLMDGQSPSGAFPTTAPRKIDQRENWPAWSDAGVICPWIMYDVYGDLRILERDYDQMKKWVEFCRASSEGGVRIAQPGIGDHLAIGTPRTPLDIVNTAYFGVSVKLLAQSAAALGKAADAAEYNALFEQIRAGFTSRFVQADGKIEGDTQADYVLALRYGLVPDALRPALVKKLVAAIDAKQGNLSTGFVGTKDLLAALSENGRADVAWKLFENTAYPSWRFSIGHGATSIWERWDGWTPENGFQTPTMNSFAHYSFGAVGQWMFDTVGGIRSDGPGFRKILIQPRPGGSMTSARVKYDSINGPVESNWTLKEGALELEVAVPANTTATVVLPAANLAGVTEGGRPVADAPGVSGAQFADGEARIAVGSGRYRFAAAQPR